MRHACIPVVAVLLLAHTGHAQQIPLTVAAAEAEGAGLSRDPAPAVLPAAYHPGSFGGIDAPLGPARQLSRARSFGFPSNVRFSVPGQWLVVAADDHDWGCFILDVADPASLEKR